MMRFREDVRSIGCGLAVGLADLPSGVAKQATSSTFAHPFGNKAKVDRRGNTQSAIRNS
jgi:hypothetical protein